MSGDDIQRVIGSLIANVDNLKARVARIEKGVIMIGAGAIGLIMIAVLKQAGFM